MTTKAAELARELRDALCWMADRAQIGNDEHHEWMRAHKALNELEAENAKLREDAERLDWLDEYLLGNGCIGRDVTRFAEGEGPGWLKFSDPDGDPSTARQSIREAIDAARKGE